MKGSSEAGTWHVEGVDWVGRLGVDEQMPDLVGEAGMQHEYII